MYICRFILSYSTIYASDLSFMIDTWSVVELKLMHLACTALSVTKRLASQPVTHALNDVVARAFSAAGIPISKTLLYMVTWQAGKPAVWDVTVTWTTAPSYLDSSSREAGAAAEMAASRKSKMANYSNLAAQHTLL